MTTRERAVQKIVNGCDEGHHWVATIIKGYFLCSRCHTIAACTICVPHASGKPTRGYCIDHHHLRTPETEQEVFA